MSDQKKSQDTVVEKKPYTQTKSLEQVQREIQENHKLTRRKVKDYYNSNKSQLNDQ